MKLKRSGLIVGVFILLFVGFYVYSTFPYILYGSLLPLCDIHNDDDIRHEVIVEVFGAYNQSIVKEKYSLGPMSGASYPKTFWFKFNRWTDYRFEVTLDEDVVRTYEGKVSNFNKVHIRIYDNESEYYPIVVDEMYFDFENGLNWDYY